MAASAMWRAAGNGAYSDGCGPAARYAKMSRPSVSSELNA
jgi:hypothetical protein